MSGATACPDKQDKDTEGYKIREGGGGESHGENHPYIKASRIRVNESHSLHGTNLVWAFKESIVKKWHHDRPMIRAGSVERMM